MTLALALYALGGLVMCGYALTEDPIELDGLADSRPDWAWLALSFLIWPLFAALELGAQLRLRARKRRK